MRCCACHEMAGSPRHPRKLSQKGSAVTQATTHVPGVPSK